MVLPTTVMNRFKEATLYSCLGSEKHAKAFGRPETDVVTVPVPKFPTSDEEHLEVNRYSHLEDSINKICGLQ